jgi:hypothetical protein
MHALQVGRLLAAGFVLLAHSSVLGQLPGADQSPPGSAARSLEQIERWFELDAPFSHHLQFRFDTRPVPTFETLRLPTYEGSALLLQRGDLTLSLSERVMPALELDCGRTCRPTIEHTLGTDARLSLGAMFPQVPESHLMVGTSMVRMPRGGSVARMPGGFSTRTMLGFGGLLDF